MRQVFVGVRLGSVKPGDVVQPTHEWKPRTVASVTMVKDGMVHLAFEGGGYCQMLSDSIVQVEVWLSC